MSATKLNCLCPPEAEYQTIMQDSVFIRDPATLSIYHASEELEVGNIEFKLMCNKTEIPYQS
jgi:hypothetical protein